MSLTVKMQPIPTVVGSGADELVKMRREALAAIRAAEAAVRKLAPHGRDYGIDDNGKMRLRLDMDIHHQRVLALSQLHSVIELEAVDILDWGK